jgi:hypothetical protein
LDLQAAGDVSSTKVRSRRLIPGLLLVAAAFLVAALPAAGKDGVKATLTTRIPLHAPAGTQLKVGWTLAYRDEHGKRHVFGGGGIFVRLLSTSGANAETSFARVGKPGHYSATVRVPKGGIRDIQIGIHGWASGPTGTRPADELFPITNDPVPG